MTPVIFWVLLTCLALPPSPDGHSARPACYAPTTVGHDLFISSAACERYRAGRPNLWCRPVTITLDGMDGDLP